MTELLHQVLADTDNPRRIVQTQEGLMHSSSLNRPFGGPKQLSNKLTRRASDSQLGEDANDSSDAAVTFSDTAELGLAPQDATATQQQELAAAWSTWRSWAAEMAAAEMMPKGACVQWIHLLLRAAWNTWRSWAAEPSFQAKRVHLQCIYRSTS